MPSGIAHIDQEIPIITTGYGHLCTVKTGMFLTLSFRGEFITPTPIWVGRYKTRNGTERNRLGGAPVLFVLFLQF